jgi:hypothetical protein
MRDRTLSAAYAISGFRGAHRVHPFAHRVQTVEADVGHCTREPVETWSGSVLALVTEGDARHGNRVATTPPFQPTRRSHPMVRPFFNDVRRMRSDVSRDDVRHAVADAWSLLTEISTSLAENGPHGEPSALGNTPCEPGWGKLEMSARTLRVMLVRRGIDAARESSTYRVRESRDSQVQSQASQGSHGGQKA